MQCDPSIKAIIAKIDGERHEFIIEDLDDETVVVKESKLGELKEKLADVRQPEAFYTLTLRQGRL